MATAAAPLLAPRAFEAAQRRVVLPLMVAAAAASLLAPPPSALQVALLILAVAAGLPHGALDGTIGRAAFRPRFGRWWALPFLGGYLLIGGAAALLWRASPGAGLACFLLLAVVHFGEGEDRAARIATGAIPVVVGCLFHPDAMRDLFALLAGERASEAVVAAAGGPLALGWAAVSALSLARARSQGWASEWAATALLFAAAPPLVAFALYFGLLHSPRALVDHAGGDVGRALRRALPWTLGAAALGAAIWWAQPPMGGGAAVRAAFLLLAWLTPPHMWLGSLARS